MPDLIFSSRLQGTPWHHIPNKWPEDNGATATAWVENIASKFAKISAINNNPTTYEEWTKQSLKFFVPEPPEGSFREWFIREPDENDELLTLAIYALASPRIEGESMLTAALDPIPELAGSEAVFTPFISNTLGEGIKAVKIIAHQNEQGKIVGSPNFSYAFQIEDFIVVIAVSATEIVALASKEQEIDEIVKNNFSLSIN